MTHHGAQLRSQAATAGSEFELHLCVVQLLRLFARVPWWHCPSGEYRSKRTAARLKMMGVRRGVPDLSLVLDGGTAAFIELKKDKGQLSKEQRELRDALEKQGALYHVARTPEEASRVLFAWGAINEDPLAFAADRRLKEVA